MWVNDKQVSTQKTGVSTSSTVEGEIPSPASLTDRRVGLTRAQGNGQRRWLTVMFSRRLFVLARERKCDAFTSQPRTSSPGKLQCDQSNVSFIHGLER